MFNLLPRRSSALPAWLRSPLTGLLAWILSGALGGLCAAPTDDGLYATFVVKRGASSVGEFSCRLEFTKVPRTVANFVALAEGTRPFVDFQRGHATRRPFYDGLTFHRVVKTPSPFIIQGGSPKGDGSDGPGFTFPDEFDGTLRHNQAGILSMANSGTNSNGSQFFVTLAATPWLDDVHSVFGQVVEGMTVVNNVQQGDVMESVRILRIGVAAQAFDVNAHRLSTVEEAEPALAKTPGGFELHYSQPANTEFFVFHADDLLSWHQLMGKELEGVSPVVAPRDVSSVTSGKPMQFFNTARVRYPDAIFTPASVVGKKLSLANVPGALVATLVFSLPTASTGTFVLTPNGGSPINGQVTSYFWGQEAYRGRFAAGTSGLTYGGSPVTSANISFVFSSSVAGTYGGSMSPLVGQPIPLAGTFTLTDVPTL